MNTSDKISRLFNDVGKNVEIGRSFKLVSKGWLTIYDQEDTWSIITSTNKNFNIVTKNGPGMIGTTIIKDNIGLSKAMILTTTGWIKNETASWWSSNDPEITEKFKKILTQKIDKAYDFNFK